MPKSTESTHAANLGNLTRLHTIVGGFGPAYAPNRAEIALSAIEAYRTRCDAALSEVQAAETVFEKAVNDREEAFSGLKPLATRIVDACKDSSATATDVADIRAINRKLQGQRTSQPKAPKAGEEPTASISASQQSFVSLADHFGKLVGRCAAISDYKGGVPELELVALNALHARLADTTRKVDEAAAKISAARTRRNQVFYSDTVNIVEVADRVRSYIRKQFTADSPEFAQLKGLRFRKLS